MTNTTRRDVCTICGAPVRASATGVIHDGTLGELRVLASERDAILEDAALHRSDPNKRHYNHLHKARVKTHDARPVEIEIARTTSSDARLRFYLEETPVE